MLQVPDPVWKQNPDIVADESYHILYDDYDDVDETDEPFATYGPD